MTGRRYVIDAGTRSFIVYAPTALAARERYEDARAKDPSLPSDFTVEETARTEGFSKLVDNRLAPGA